MKLWCGRFQFQIANKQVKDARTALEEMRAKIRDTKGEKEL